MSTNKLLTSSIMLFCLWIVCISVINVGGEVHLMLLFAVVSFLAYFFNHRNHHRNIALKH